MKEKLTDLLWASKACEMLTSTTIIENSMDAP